MNEFQSLTLEGMPFFADKTTFDLSRKGVSLILGRNQDSSNQGTNGCGKSLFFSQLPEILIGEPTIGVQKDLIRKGSVEFTLKKPSGTVYTVNRTFKPGEKITIARDGKDLEYRELSAAKAALKKLLPFNAEEVLSLLYLDSRIPHPLVRGTSAVRKAFFTQFFRMNSAPVMRKLVKAELDALKMQQGSYDVRRLRLQEINARLKEHNLESLESRQRKIKASLKELEIISKRYSDVERIRDDWRDQKAEYKVLSDMGVFTWGEAQGKAEVVDAHLTSIGEDLSAWKRYDAWQEGQQELRERKQAVKHSLKSYPALSALTVKQINAVIETGAAAFEEVDKTLENLQSKLREVSQDREDDIKRDLKAARAKEKELEEASGECPTCGAPYDNKHAKKEMRTLDARITDMQVAIEEIAEKRAIYEARRIKQTAIYNKHVDEIETLKKVRKLLIERESWEEQDAVKEPKKDRDLLVKNRAKFKEQYSMLLASKPVFYALSAWEELTAEDKALLKTEAPTDKLLKLHEEMGEIKMLIEEITGLMAEKEELVTVVSDLKKQLDEKPELEILFEGLSPRKGVESLMIKLVCQRLEQQVNKYARLLFPEDFRFSFELETQFSILVTRKYGKKEITSDVRKLSGAESLLFSLILLIALLAFVPAKNRCNLLILDEPTATFGPEMIDAFVKFLPVLNTVIPHIIVITPLPNNLYEGAKIFTVVKKNGKSRIVEGTEITKVTRHDSRRSGNTTSVAARRKTAV